MDALRSEHAGGYSVKPAVLLFVDEGFSMPQEDV
jgi:hypothetical protein